MAKKYLIGFLIGAVFIYFAFRNIEPEKFINAFLDANYFWIVAASALIVFSHWLRALRWQSLLRPIRLVSLNQMFKATLIGYFSGYLLPLRIGELVRAIVLNRLEDIPLSSNLGSIFVERILDLLSMLFIFGITLAVFNFPSPIRKGGEGVLLVSVISILLILFAVRKPAETRNLFARWVQKLPVRFRDRADRWVEQFIEGMKGLGQVRRIPAILFLSLFMWLIYVLDVYLVMIAFHFEVPLIAPFVIIVTTAFAQMLPSAPGQLGAFQLACQIGLAYFNISKDTALSFSFVLQAIQMIPLAIYSIYYLPGLGISLTKVVKSS